MRFVIRAIIFGILTGAFLFFFPFHFFLFPVLFVFLMIRLFFRPWRWRQRYAGFGPYGGYRHFAGCGPQPDDDRFVFPMPIDGFGYDRRSQRNKEADRNINIQ
jgi:hypothetical protein